MGHYKEVRESLSNREASSGESNAEIHLKN
jgi:hypothetical protein